MKSPKYSRLVYQAISEGASTSAEIRDAVDRLVRKFHLKDSPNFQQIKTVIRYAESNGHVSRTKIKNRCRYTLNNVGVAKYIQLQSI